MMTDKLARLDRKIQRLEKKKEKMETQLAVSFFKRTQKIFGEAFCPDFTLEILTYLWSCTSEIPKEDPENRSHPFSTRPTRSNRKTTSPTNSTPQQN